MEKYNTRLKDLREDHDLTQAQVAEIIGTSQQHYGKYENGRIIIPFDRVITLAEYYNVSLDYIAGFTNSPNHIKKSDKK
ncbi:MAG: helix-turn-helix transcriptional regulator [Oscillospiraceae bacterium]|nr:helix-turn-helix transcriptional regulator [Oscillospiraceae bacterium]